MSEQKLIEASGLIKAKKFSEARKILNTIPNNPTAQSWLKKLDAMDSQSELHLDESDILDKARQLIREKKYDQARNTLKHISHNPTAKNWLQKIDELDDPFASISSSTQNLPQSKKHHQVLQVPPHKEYGNSGYISENLRHGEYIIFKTKYHKIMMCGNSLAIFFLVTIFASNPSLATAIVFATFITFPFLIFDLRNWTHSEFGITNQRIIIRTGAFHKLKELLVTFDLVESVEIYNTFLGRIFGFKNITIKTTQGTEDMFKFIVNAKEFKRYANMFVK